MKWGFFLSFLILFLIGCSQLERSPQSYNREKELHVVLDIDWTIVSNFEPEFSDAPIDRLVEADGKKYVIRDGLEELIEYLLEENIKVSFFSGGTKVRNEELLSRIYLRDGRSLKDIAYRVKNFDDLTVVPNVPETAKFQEKYKKDMHKIHADLKQLAWFDDATSFYIDESQKRNLVHIGPSFKFFENFDQALKHTGNYIPDKFGMYYFDRKKMDILKFHIQEALKLVDEKKVTFSEAIEIVAKKIDYAKGDYNPYTQKTRIKLDTTKNSRPCRLDLIPFLK